MKHRTCLLGVLVALLWAAPARADNRFIVRSTLPLSQLKVLCVPLSAVCTSVSALNDPLHQLFLVTSPLNLSGLLNLGGTLLGIVDAEVDQILNLIGPTSTVGTLASLDMTAVPYCGGTVWNGYATQPATGVVNVAQAQNNCTITGTGIVADIDT